MKILMIAPEPFFEPRGTPFSEYFRIRALCAQGHEVNLVTYPVGENRQIKGLTITRCYNPFHYTSIKTGPSVRKIILDFFLFWKALSKSFGARHDMIHTHEEANIMGAVIAGIHRIFRFRRLPHLYDMHSSLVQQMDNFNPTRFKIINNLLKIPFHVTEWISLKHARSVIVICPTLHETAAKYTASDKLTMIENFMEEETPPPDPVRRQKIREEIAAGDRKVILYAGTLEHYQGIPLLLASMAKLDDSFLLVLVGGKPEQVEKIRREAEHMGLANRVILTGRKPPEDIPCYMREAHVLVSPRSHGTNIPLKIYSFLKSGLPVVATNLLTHTQTLNREIAILVDDNPEAFARGIRDAVSPLGQETARRAREFCRIHYSNERYMELVKTAVNKAVSAQ